MNRQFRTSIYFIRLIPIFLIFFLFTAGFSDDTTGESSTPPILVSPDINDDGELNILILGTSQSINNASGAFSGDKIGYETAYTLMNLTGIIPNCN